MKRKEREHLKEDPFRNFVSAAIEKYREYRKIILTAGISLLVVLLIVSSVFYIKSVRSAEDNYSYAQAMEICKSDMSVNQKINALGNIELKGNVSEIIPVLKASYLFQINEFKKAETVLKELNASGSSVRAHKIALIAEIKASEKDNKEAVRLLDTLLDKSEYTEVQRDFVLLRKAEILIASGDKKEAKKTLEDLKKDYPESVFVINRYFGGTGDVERLLENIDKN